MSKVENKILTFSGKLVDPFNMTTHDICIEDIAHGLSLTNRFGGHTRTPYSVAQHSVILSHVVEVVTGSARQALNALLHDASEAFVGDIPSPMKHRFPELILAEKSIEELIYHMYTYDEGISEIVHKYDKQIVSVEAQHLKPHYENAIWNDYEPIVQDVFLKYYKDYGWKYDKDTFLNRFHQLQEEVNNELGKI